MRQGDIQELVLERLKTMPEHVQVHMGDIGVFEKADLIREVKDETKLGKKIMEFEMAYLRALKDL